MRNVLLWLAVLITLLAAAVEAYSLNALAYHVWAGSFAEADRQSHHQTTIRQMACVSTLVPCALAWVWVVTVLLRRRGDA